MENNMDSNNNYDINPSFNKDYDFHIGMIIKYIRSQRHMTQAQVSNGICSVKYLRVLEKGLHNPSTYIISLLSERLNVDLYHYYKNIKECGDIETFDIIYKINSAIREMDTQLAEELLNKYCDTPKLQSGQAFQKLCHIKAMIQFYNYQNYSATIDYCLQGIKYYHKDFDLKNLEKESIFSIEETAMLNTIGMCYGSMNDIENAYKIFAYLVNYTKDKISNSKFSSIRNRNNEEVFCYATTNLMECLNIFGRCQEALKVADEGIEIIAQSQYFSKLSMIYLQRMVAAYKLGQDDIVKKSYDCSMVFFHILYDKEFLLELRSILHQYPDINKIIEHSEPIW